MTFPRHAPLLLGTIAIALALSACGSSASTTAEPSSANGPASAAATSSAPAAASAAPSAAATSAAAQSETEPLSGPCDLLTLEQIEAATGVAVTDGEQKDDEARQIQMCTWQSSDPFVIVAASLTDVGAAEAFQTNFDLAPAYFDGDPVTITLPGADKAYAVQQPDVGWVVGAIAKGRFVQVQVGGTDITQAQASTLVENAIARMPAEG